jgi:hypothetical protein
MKWLTIRTWILISAIVYSLTSASPVSCQAPPSFFGLDIHSGVLSSQPWPSVPFGSVRLWDTGTRWNDLEPSKGIYSWANLDGYLALAQTHKVDVLYTFGGTAEWAASGAGSQCADNPGGCYPPSNIQDWDQFVTALVAHSAGKIKYWELWNEANVPEFWEGNLPTLVVLAQHAYVIIKAADPSAVVLCPSSSGSSLDVANFLNAYFADGGLSSADSVSFHGYVGPAPEAVLDYVTAVRASMASVGIAEKPIWDTEGSWGTDSSLPSTGDGPGYLAREFILQFSSGVARFYWYAWNNPVYGTLWTTNGITSAGIAYGQVYDWLYGATMNSPCSMAADYTWTCALTRTGGSQALAIWNSATTKSYVPSSEYKSYLDLAGTTNLINGSVSIGYIPILLLASSPVASPTNLSAHIH